MPSTPSQAALRPAAPSAFGSMVARAQLAAAAVSITLAGRVWSEAPLGGAALPALAAVLLVGLTYGFNVVADEAAASGRPVRLTPSWGALLAALTLALAVVVAFLPPAARVAAGVIFTVGIAYSLTFNFGGRTLRIRNTYILKNASIALAWTCLVPLGSPEQPLDPAILLVVFVQVFIGSVLRDVDDVADDGRTGVSTLAVRHGVAPTLAVLFVMNALLVPALAFLPGPASPWLLLPVAWRFGLLLTLALQTRRGFFLQFANLATCHLLLVASELAR